MFPTANGNLPLTAVFATFLPPLFDRKTAVNQKVKQSDVWWADTGINFRQGAFPFKDYNRFKIKLNFIFNNLYCDKNKNKNCCKGMTGSGTSQWALSVSNNRKGL